MAERDQLMRPLRRHDAGDPRRRQHVALFGLALEDQIKRGRRHGDKTLGGRAARRHLLIADIDHTGFAFLIEMAEAGAHCAASLSCSPVSSARVAAATSACRIRLSPTRNAFTPDLASLSTSSWVKMPLSPITMRSAGKTAGNPRRALTLSPENSH